MRGLGGQALSPKWLTLTQLRLSGKAAKPSYPSPSRERAQLGELFSPHAPRHPREGGDPSPNAAPSGRSRKWLPAFAEMTKDGMGMSQSGYGSEIRALENWHRIPAKWLPKAHRKRSRRTPGALPVAISHRCWGWKL